MICLKGGATQRHIETVHQAQFEADRRQGEIT